MQSTIDFTPNNIVPATCPPPPVLILLLLCPAKVPYIIKHFLCLFFSSSRLRGFGAPSAVSCVVRSVRTRFVKRNSTLCAVLAEVSTNLQPKDRARATPSSIDTSRWWVLSHLFPTSMNIGFCIFTRRTDCRKASSLSKVARDVIE
jgi:hypothetical protein